MSLLVAKDSGYGAYKGFAYTGSENGGKFYSYPAIISSAKNLPGGDSLATRDILDDLFVNYRGKDYWLGEKAFSNRTRTFNLDPNKLSTETEIIKLLGGLGYINHLTGKKEFKVVTGIPVQQYNSFKNVVSNSWVGAFNFSFRGKNLTLKIEKVLPTAQGAGVYYDMALGWDKVLDNHFFEKRVLIFDFGTKTTNVVPMQKGQYISDMALTVWTGVSEIHVILKIF